MILGLRAVVEHLLQSHLGGTVADFPPGHMAVYDIDDGVIHPAAADLVNDHLAVAPKLGRNAIGYLLQRFQSFCLHSPTFPCGTAELPRIL